MPPTLTENQAGGNILRFLLKTKRGNRIGNQKVEPSTTAHESYKGYASPPFMCNPKNLQKALPRIYQLCPTYRLHTTLDGHECGLTHCKPEHDETSGAIFWATHVFYS